MVEKEVTRSDDGSLALDSALSKSFHVNFDSFGSMPQIIFKDVSFINTAM
jgi:hypothetical protein